MTIRQIEDRAADVAARKRMGLTSDRALRQMKRAEKQQDCALRQLMKWKMLRRG